MGHVWREGKTATQPQQAMCINLETLCRDAVELAESQQQGGKSKDEAKTACS